MSRLRVLARHLCFLAFLGAVLVRAPAPSAAAAPQVNSALEASPRAREALWARRHATIKSEIRRRQQRRSHGHAGGLDVLLLGDSIIQGWEYKGRWHRLFPRLDAVNAGIASDRVEHVLWRARDAQLAMSRPKVIVLLAGVNNLAMHDADRIAATQAQTIRTLLDASPSTRILLLGVLPSGHRPDHPRRIKAARLNARLARLADGSRVHFLDIGGRLLAPDGTLPKAIAFDALHLTARGYKIWADAMAPKLQELLASDRI